MNAHAKIIWTCPTCGHENILLMVPFSDKRGGSAWYFNCQNAKNCLEMFSVGFFVETLNSDVTKERIKQLDDISPLLTGESK